MKLTVKVLLHPYKREDGTHQVRARLTRGGVAAFLDSGFTVPPAYWSTKVADHINRRWIKAGDDNAESRNATLRQLLNDADEIGRANPLLSAAEVRDLLAGSLGRPREKKATGRPDGAPDDLVAFAAWYVKKRALSDKPNTVLFYHNAANALRQWREGLPPVPLVELSTEHLDAFHSWLLSRPNLYPGTARDRMVKVSTMVLHAVRLELLPARLNPFKHYRLPMVGSKNPPARPTEDARKAVMALDLATVPVPRTRRAADYRRALEVRRDIWALQYRVRGTRIGDVLQLRERDLRPDRISFAETKTGKGKATARTAAINAILARYPPTGNPLAYVFPCLDHTQPYAALHPSLDQLAQLNTELRARTQWVNNGLRTLAALAGVPPFTSHSARHMFAEKVYTATKDLWLVKNMLQHTKVATTEQYMKVLGHDELDAATDSILGED